MLTRIHRKLGTAGFIISIVALVAALGGGAYAASGGLSGKQKKEVTKIAQTEAKKYAGKKGPAGPQGPAGATGATGVAGSNGKDGSAGEKGEKGEAGAEGHQGKPGESVTVTKIDPGEHECSELGGALVELENSPSGGVEVCNGKAGANGTTGYASELPSGKTETGTWAAGEFSLSDEEHSSGPFVPISFPFKLTAGGYFVEYMKFGAAATANCKGTFEAPAAEPGWLCVYSSTEEEGAVYNRTFRPEEENGEGASRSGAVLTFTQPEKKGHLYGSWAVTSH